MGSDVVVVGELPVLPPIKTGLIGREKPAAAAAAAEGGTKTAGDEADVRREECVTPKGEEHALKPAIVCPPAPRKPRPAKRALHDQQAAPSKGFHVVPRDLSSVFLTLPPKKRIRVG